MFEYFKHLDTIIDSLYVSSSSSSSSSSLWCIRAWESSLFWHWLLHWHISVQAKSFTLQEHLPEEQPDLHLPWTISRMAFGAGRTSVVIGFSNPSICLWYPARGDSLVWLALKHPYVGRKMPTVHQVSFAVKPAQPGESAVCLLLCDYFPQIPGLYCS